MTFKNRILIYSGSVLLSFVLLFSFISVDEIKNQTNNQISNIKDSITDFNEKLLSTFIKSQDLTLSREIDLINKEVDLMAFIFDHNTLDNTKKEWLAINLLRIYEDAPEYIKSVNYIDMEKSTIYRFSGSKFIEDELEFNKSNILKGENIYLKRDPILGNINGVVFYTHLYHLSNSIFSVEINLNYFIELLDIEDLDNDFDFKYFLLDKKGRMITASLGLDNLVSEDKENINKTTEKILNRTLDKHSGSMPFTMGGKVYNLIFEENNKTGWYVFLITPASVIEYDYLIVESLLLSSSEDFLNYSLFLVNILLFIFLFINSMVIKNVTSPLNELITQAKYLRDQNYKEAMETIGNNGDEIEQLSTVFSDASSKMKELVGNLEHKVEERTIQLESATKEATNANVQKTVFLSNVSHEIRTPLNAIIGYTDILSNKKHIDVDNYYLSGISTASHTILNIVNDILDLERVKNSNYVLKEKEISLCKLLKDIESMFIPLSFDKGISFSVNNQVGKSAFIIVDSLRFKQAISNIISNAIKFTNEGFVRLDVNISESGSILFTIIDSGIGIPENKRSLIFKNHEQVNDDDQKYGFGLGLTITQTIVGLMKGSLSVESILGEGSQFTVELPSHIVSYKGKVIEDDKLTALTIKEKDFSNTVALVVDDVEFNREILQFQLELLGIKCVLAESGVEAIDVFNESNFDIVFTDISMPNMDGVELSKRLKMINNELPVIAVTARATVQEESKLNSHFDSYITKPIDKYQVLSALSCTLNS